MRVQSAHQNPILSCSTLTAQCYCTHSLPIQTMDSLVSMSKLNCSPSPPDCSRISGPRSILHLPQRQAVQPVSLERKRPLVFAMALMVFSAGSCDTFPKAFTTKHSNSPSDSRASVPERRNENHLNAYAYAVEKKIQESLM